MSIELVILSNHFILCCLLIVFPSTFPSFRVFFNELALCIRWPKYWSFSFSISPSNEYSGSFSFRIDWLDLLAVQGTLNSLLQHHNLKPSVLRCSAFFMVQLSHPYMTTGETIALIIQTFVSKGMLLLCGSDDKESACKEEDLGSVPGSRRYPGERNGYLLQYSCLENPMDRGAWQARLQPVGCRVRRGWTTHTVTFTSSRFVPAFLPRSQRLLTSWQRILLKKLRITREHDLKNFFQTMNIRGNRCESVETEYWQGTAFFPQSHCETVSNSSQHTDFFPACSQISATIFTSTVHAYGYQGVQVVWRNIASLLWTAYQLCN